MSNVTVTQNKDGYYKVIYPKTSSKRGNSNVLGIHNCPICNKEFEVLDARYIYHKGSRYFCSYSCLNTYKRTKNWRPSYE